MARIARTWRLWVKAIGLRAALMTVAETVVVLLAAVAMTVVLRDPARFWAWGVATAALVVATGLVARRVRVTPKQAREESDG